MERLRSFVISRCPECSNSYSTRNFQSRVEKKPLILPCSHCVCESCLVKELKAPGDTFRCKDCSDKITAPPQYSSSKPEAEFPVNYYLLGLSVLKSKASEDSGIGFSRAKSFKQSAGKAGKKCNECIERFAERQCLQCAAPYCSICFTKVHESARALRLHVSIDIESSTGNPPVRSACSRHASRPQQIWCDQCSQAICTTCLMSDHSGHKATPLEDKNKEVFDSLVDTHIKVVNIATRLKNTTKKAQMVVTRRSVEPLKAERQISDFFSRLHGALLLKQHHLLAALYAPSRGQANDLRSLIADMETTSDELDQLLAATRLAIADRRLMANASFPELVDMLSKHLEEPCYLLMNDLVDNSEFHIDEEKILDALNQHCNLKSQEEVDARYRLVTAENLPEDFTIDPILDVTRDTLFKSPSLLGNQSVSAVSTLSLSSALSVSKYGSSASSKASTSSDVDSNSTEVDATQSNYYFDELLPGCNLLVKVVHAISPNDFYVRKVSAEKKLIDLDIRINEVHFSIKKKLSFIKINRLYMVQYSKDKKWYRGSVISEIDNGYKVFYIDYGNNEIVSKDRIRQMPTSLFKPPGLALHCSLNGCAPIKGDTWKPDALAKMLKVIGNSPVHLTIQSKTESTLYVDMHKVDSDQGTISIQDALIFFGVAVYLTNVNVKPIASVPSKTIDSPPYLKPGEVVECIVSSIVSPDDFYIQKVVDKKRLLVLQDALQEFYSKKTEKFFIYSPKEGSLVAAMQSSNNHWYRAKIIDVPASMMVTVQYIDYGNSEQIGWQRIRQLANKFYHNYQMCYKCSLVDVKPVNEEWNPEARCVLSSAVNDPRDASDMSMVVHSAEDGVYRVVLYRRAASVWLCINAILVDEGAAISTGSNSTIIQYTTPGSVEGPSSDQENHASRHDGEMSRKIVSSSNEPIKVHVRIARIVSPGEFYITLDSVVESLAQMQRDLNSTYSQQSSAFKLDKVEVGSTCVVKKDDSQWYRGYIECIIGNTFQVHLLDTGDTIDVQEDQLFQLAKEFAEQHDGTKRCYLGGILPPFDDEGWPLTATADFKEVTDKYKDNIFITGIKTTTENKDGSIPVNFLIKEEIIAGALEPTRTKWTSVNNLLRKKGLAKSDGLFDWDMETSFETFNKSNKRFLDEILILPAKYHGLASNVEEAIEAVPQLAERHSAPIDLVAGRRSVTASISSGPDVVTSIPPPLMPAAWPAPLPFVRLEFIANPTNVDNECSIFIQDFQASIVILKRISAQLENVCKHSLPMPYDFYWNVGDTCICRYHADQMWYRGVIMEVDENKEMTVLMVDYGSIEDKITVEDVRKMPLMADIPIQGQFCRINKIKPYNGNKWTLPDLDKIHALVVEKHCPVLLEELPDNKGYEIVKITLSSGVDLFEHLVTEKLARYTDDLPIEDKPLLEEVEEVRRSLASVDVTAVVEEVVHADPPSQQEPATPTAEVPSVLKVSPLKPFPADFSSAVPSQNVSAFKPTSAGMKLVKIPSSTGIIPADIQSRKSPLIQIRESSSSIDRSASLTSPLSVSSSKKEALIATSRAVGKAISAEQITDENSWVLECERAGLLDTHTDSTETPLKPMSSSPIKPVNSPTVALSSTANTETEDNDDLFDTEESIFLPMTIPLGTDKFDVDVQIITRPNAVTLQISESNDISLQHARMEFANLMSNISNEADGQPPITVPVKGLGCVAKFSADQCWYRGVIEEVCNENRVLVRYVDYGNIEILPLSELRQIKFEWTGVEVQGIEAELYNIVAPTTSDSLKAQLQKTLCGGTFTAVVKEREPKLIVELFNCGTHRRAYQDLIDSGFLQFSEKMSS